MQHEKLTGGATPPDHLDRADHARRADRLAERIYQGEHLSEPEVLSTGIGWPPRPTSTP